MASSSNSSKRVNVTKRSEQKATLTCYHDMPVTHQRCKRPPNKGRKFYGRPLWKVNQDYGYFKWDEEEDMSIREMNMLLEERVEDLAVEVEKWHIFVNNLKGLKARSNMEGSVEFLLNELKMLEENTTLRSKISKEKMKRDKVEEELKQLKEEMIAMKMIGFGNNGVERLCMCLAFVMVVILLVRLIQ